MKENFSPQTTLGKWSIGLNTFFLIAIAASIALVKVLKILSFDDHWWDVTVGIAFPTSVIALIIGIIAARKNKDYSVSVSLSIFIGLCTVLFIIFHSLFIND
jgi:energy-converting hydrogenase Eha subunit A